MRRAHGRAEICGSCEHSWEDHSLTRGCLSSSLRDAAELTGDEDLVCGCMRTPNDHAARQRALIGHESQLDAMLCRHANEVPYREGGTLTTRDDCSFCHGESGGVKGNENVIKTEDGERIICDYCSAKFSRIKSALENYGGSLSDLCGPTIIDDMAVDVLDALRPPEKPPRILESLQREMKGGYIR